MRATYRTAALAAAAFLALTGAASAQLGRESKHPETGPAGALLRGYRGYGPYPTYQPYPTYRADPYSRGVVFDRGPRGYPVYGY